jgi:hypothetical protein
MGHLSTKLFHHLIVWSKKLNHVKSVYDITEPMAAVPVIKIYEHCYEFQTATVSAKIPFVTAILPPVTIHSTLRLAVTKTSMIREKHPRVFTSTVTARASANVTRRWF